MSVVVFRENFKRRKHPPGKVTVMKIELCVEGKVLLIEAEGAISLQVRDAHDEIPLPLPSVPVVLHSAPASVPADGDLFAKLVGLRKQLASEQGVPPYVIFHDKTLREMIEKAPADLQALGQVDGVGRVKLERYGSRFLALLHGAAA